MGVAVTQIMHVGRVQCRDCAPSSQDLACVMPPTQLALLYVYYGMVYRHVGSHRSRPLASGIAFMDSWYIAGPYVMQLLVCVGYLQRLNYYLHYGGVWLQPAKI
jgi:hypothetical protein